MYMLTLKDRTTDGAYAVSDKNGQKILLMFEESDCLLYTSDAADE